jgi:hypothetical protein
LEAGNALRRGLLTGWREPLLLPPSPALVGLLIASGFVVKIFKALAGLKSLARICIASLTVYAVLLADFLPSHRPLYT